MKIKYSILYTITMIEVYIALNSNILRNGINGHCSIEWQWETTPFDEYLI